MESLAHFSGDQEVRGVSVPIPQHSWRGRGLWERSDQG